MLDLTITPANAAAASFTHGRVYSNLTRIEVELGDSYWYGLGALHKQDWPLNKLSLPSAPFITQDNGKTGLLGILEPLIISSAGEGVLVKSDSMALSFNAEQNGKFSVEGEDLKVILFEKKNAREVVEAYYSMLNPLPSIPHEMLNKPMFTTWAHFKNDINQQKIIEYAKRLQEFSFDCSVFGIDAKWQSEFGELSFDSEKFASPVSMVKSLQQMGMQVTLWSAPFFPTGSNCFQNALAADALIKNLHGEPYVGSWWEGTASFLDAANPAAMSWYLQRHIDFAKESGIDGFKFDAGEGQYLSYRNAPAWNNTPANLATQNYTNCIAEAFPWSDARACWRNQSCPLLFRQWDKATSWDLNNGLHSCITQALSLNLLGYRHSFPDMIGGNQYGDSKIDQELMIRWTQAVSAMPIIQFSAAPWELGEDCARTCSYFAALRKELTPFFLKAAKEHAPILRPVWWLAPEDPQALACNDQYLIGNDLLAAPVIKPGSDRRDIYLPPGDWKHYFKPEQVYNGSSVLFDYHVDLEELPLFSRI